MKHKSLVLFFGLTLAYSSEAKEQQEVIKPDNNTETLELLAKESEAADDATQIKVIVQKKQTIEEYRQRGELVLVKVIPNDGVPYFIDPLERQKNLGSGRDLINSGVKPVRWVLKEF